jgi:hypothetical protein
MSSRDGSSDDDDDDDDRRQRELSSGQGAEGACKRERKRRRRGKSGSFRFTFCPEVLHPLSYRAFELWGRKRDDSRCCREEEGAKRRAKWVGLTFMQKKLHSQAPPG